MWQRDESQPVNYTGVPFRSGLEATVAKAFDDLEVEWAYERGVEGINWYLPDFTILNAPAALELPHWVEVKPSELLYAVRDHFGIPERFTDTIERPITAQQLQQLGIEEVWKPKALAEHEYESVLVVSKINRNRTLSIEMFPEYVRLSRSQPCVCWREVKAEQERERRRLEWARQAAVREVQRAQEDADRRANNLAWARSVTARQARYDGWCIVCSTNQPSRLLSIGQHEGRWHAFCTEHVIRG